MRALIYFLIIYSHEDLGTLAKAANDLRTDEQEKKYLDATGHFWEMIITTIEGLGLNYQHLKLYQDGLPVCGKEKEIVDDVAESESSQSFRLLHKLYRKGAVIIVTESPELLLQ